MPTHNQKLTYYFIQAKGEARQDKASVENDLSHTVGKVGPYSVSGSGGVSKDSSDRTEGSWNQTVGSAKESIGNLVGHDGLKQAGIDQNREGKAQEAQGQLSDFGSGVGDRVTGAVGGAVAGLTGDREAQKKYQDRHDDGKTAQRSAEADIQRSKY